MTSLTAAATPDVHEMVVIHRVFRREFAAIPDLVRRVADGDTKRARRVGGHLRLIMAGLHMHHTGEDEVLWPLLRTRAAPSTGLVETMEVQHARVEECVADIGRAERRWQADPTAPLGDELAAGVQRLATALVEHLDLEEREILPLVSAHVSAEEWDSLGEHGKDAMSARELPLMFGAILEEATDEERGRMLAHQPAPVRVVMRTAGAWQYRRCITAVRGR